MIRIAAVVLSLTLVSTTSALAQPKAPKAPATDSITTALVGTWEGTYQSDHGSGAFTMKLGHDSVWTASMEMSMPDGSGTIPTKVNNFAVSGSNVTWTQELMGMACKSTAVLAAGTLRGETSCGQGSIGYLLKKK